MSVLIATASPRAPVILAVFAMTYIGLAMGHVPGLKLNRAGIALLGAIAMMIFGGVTTADVVSSINWPTIFLLFGFFVISAQLRLSGFYDQVANAISARLGSPAKFLFVLMAVTGGLSAFLNHDIVCYVFTPIVGMTLLRKRINPVPFLVALAIASNFGAAATLIGNPQDMMIGQVAHLDFGPYLLWCSVPVLLAMGAAYGIIWWLSRKRLQPASPAPVEPDYSATPFNRFHTLKGLVILVVVVGLFFSGLPREIIALAAAGIHLASPKFRTEDLLRLVEWPILILDDALRYGEPQAGRPQRSTHGVLGCRRPSWVDLGRCRCLTLGCEFLCHGPRATDISANSARSAEWGREPDTTSHGPDPERRIRRDGPRRRSRSASLADAANCAQSACTGTRQLVALTIWQSQLCR